MYETSGGKYPSINELIVADLHMKVQFLCFEGQKQSWASFIFFKMAQQNLDKAYVNLL